MKCQIQKHQIVEMSKFETKKKKKKLKLVTQKENVILNIKTNEKF